MRNGTDGFFASAIYACIRPLTISEGSKTKTRGEKNHKNPVWFLHKTINWSQLPRNPAPGLGGKQLSRPQHHQSKPEWFQRHPESPESRAERGAGAAGQTRGGSNPAGLPPSTGNTARASTGVRITAACINKGRDTNSF